MNEELKKCSKCGRGLPKNSDYFYFANTKDGFNSKCKECCGRKFTDKLVNIPKCGNIFCKKCKRELPHTSQYFQEDKSCKTGLRNVCRECNPSYGRFLNDNEITAKKWSDEEKELIKKVYKDYTNKELVEKFFPKRTVKSVSSMAYQLGCSFKTEETLNRGISERSKLISNAMTGRIITKEWREKISESRKEYFKTNDGWWKGKKRSKEQCDLMSHNAKERGYWKGDKNPRHINPLNGDKNGRWNGGIMDTYKELRSDTKDWFNASIKYCNYSCIITNKNFDNVHHVISFKDIVNETFRNVNIDIKSNVKDYTDSEIKKIKNMLKELHIFYGYGACLNIKVHKLFHDYYGYTNFSSTDFLDFIYKIEDGLFDKWFAENNLEICINYNYVDYIKDVIHSLEEKVC